MLEQNLAHLENEIKLLETQKRAYIRGSSRFNHLASKTFTLKQEAHRIRLNMNGTNRAEQTNRIKTLVGG